MSSGDPQDFAQGGREFDEEELMNAQRAAYEEQLSRVSSAEMTLQAAVSLLGVGGRRLGLVPGSEGQRDLEQVRDAIDGVRGLLPVLERRMPQELGPLRDALSQLQMAYAQEARADASETAESAEQPADPTSAKGSAPGQTSSEKPADGADDASGEGEGSSGPGPAESSGRLWVPDR